MSNKQTILVVDDEPIIRTMLAQELEESYDVMVAKDGLEAIFIYEHHVERVTAIVTDLEMPRLNGRLVTEWVHHINPRLPIIVMSGSMRDVDLEELLRSRYVTFVAKPFEPSRLKALLSKAIEMKQSEAA